MTIKKKAPLRNAIGLPNACQNTFKPTHLDLREAHFQKALGLSSTRASLLSNLIDMECNSYGR